VPPDSTGNWCVYTALNVLGIFLCCVFKWISMRVQVCVKTWKFVSFRMVLVRREEIGAEILNTNKVKSTLPW